MPTQVQTNSNEVQTGPTPSSSLDDSGSEQEKPSSIINWDDDLWQSRLVRQMMEEKEHRRQELLLIRREKDQIDRDRSDLEEHRRQVEAREARLFELEGKYCDILPLIPSAKQLLELGIDFHQALVFIDVIHQKAEAEKIDLKTASLRVSEELKLYTQLTSLQKKIQQAQQQFATLNLLNVQKQQAVIALMTLQGWGVSVEEI